jgi:hypothetical protein
VASRGAEVTADTTHSAPDGEPRPTGHRALWWALGILVAFFLLAGAAVWNAHRLADETVARHRKKFAEEVAVLSARPRGRPAILEPVVAGSAEDVIETFLKAVDAVPAAERERLEPFNFDTSNPAVPGEEDRILAAHPAPPVALEPLLHVPSSPPFPRLDDAGATTARRIPRIQNGGKWLLAAATRAAARGDFSMVLRLAAAQASFGADVSRSPTLIDWLVGTAIASTAFPALRKALAAAPLPAAELRRLARTLDALDSRRPSLVEMCDVERVSFRGLLAGPTADVSGLDGSTTREAGWRYLWSGRIERAAALDSWDAEFDPILSVLRSLAQSDAQGLALSRRNAIDETEQVRAAADNPLTKLALSIWPVVIKKDAERSARWRVARVSIAVAIHVAEKRSLPATLADLVPAYLAAVPIDPWDGKPIRYATTATGATIWSIGRDGKDDGGKPYADPDDFDGPGDIVFTVASPK